MKERKTTLGDVEKVKALRSEGVTVENIAKTTGLARNTVSRILGGWKPVGRKPVPLPPKPRPAPEIPKYLPQKSDPSR